jgi:hypothetical protein
MSGPEPGAFRTSPRVKMVEDALNLFCVAALFLVYHLSQRYPAWSAGYVPLALVGMVIYVRRKMRLDRLMAAMRKYEAEHGASAVPGVPMPLPGRMDGAQANGRPPELAKMKRKR